MQIFATARDAKEFLIGRIVEEARREGVPLSEVERKMLYFSETAWTLPDIAEVNDAFDRDYDQKKYEQKVAMLSRNFTTSASKNNEDDLSSWKAAIRILRQEDHYLLVLIVGGNESSHSGLAKLLKLLLIGTALAVVALLFGYFLLGKIR